MLGCSENSGNDRPGAYERQVEVCVDVVNFFEGGDEDTEQLGWVL